MFIIKQTKQVYNAKVTSIVRGEINQLSNHFKPITKSGSKTIDTLMSKLSKVGGYELVNKADLKPIEQSSVVTLK